MLNRYVSTGADGINRFAYARVTDADRAVLKRYISKLETIPISQFNRNQQFAFWVNLYNAVTVDVMLENYPVNSIRDIRPSGILIPGPWRKKLVTVEGNALTLDNIEHNILRPIWRDPRVHYAVNCASIGCPNLNAEPFYGERLNEQLEAAARAYVNHPRGLSIDAGRVTVSTLYKWFAHDFGNSQQGVIEHLAKYATTETGARLKQIGKISDTGYDWSINE